MYNFYYRIRVILMINFKIIILKKKTKKNKQSIRIK